MIEVDSQTRFSSYLKRAASLVQCASPRLQKNQQETYGNNSSNRSQNRGRNRSCGGRSRGFNRDLNGSLSTGLSSHQMSVCRQLYNEFNHTTHGSPQKF